MSHFIFFHFGAGDHSATERDIYKKLCSKVSEASLKISKSSDSISSVYQVTEAIQQLENSPYTNAGLGSNLTYSGIVECDACITSGKNGCFGSVGAVSGFKNPIKIASALCEMQSKSSDASDSVMPPAFLVGRCAVEWYKNTQDPHCNTNEILETREQKLRYRKWSRRLKQSTATAKQILPKLDTVGAIFVSSTGNIAAGSSSGGMLLKTPGRIGQAAVNGAGCFANSTLGIVVSGNGEYIMRTHLAYACAMDILQTDSSDEPLGRIVEKSVRSRFLDNGCLPNPERREVGLLVVKRVDDQIELVWAHTTPSFILGFKSSKMERTKFIHSTGLRNTLTVSGRKCS